MARVNENERCGHLIAPFFCSNCFFCVFFILNATFNLSLEFVLLKGARVISTSDLRKGSKFLYRDEPHVVISFQRVNPGKRGAFALIKMKKFAD